VTQDADSIAWLQPQSAQRSCQSCHPIGELRPSEFAILKDARGAMCVEQRCTVYQPRDSEH
jgi:hypothetical protein